MPVLVLVLVPKLALVPALVLVPALALVPNLVPVLAPVQALVPKLVPVLVPMQALVPALVPKLVPKLALLLLAGLERTFLGGPLLGVHEGPRLEDLAAEVRPLTGLLVAVVEGDLGVEGEGGLRGVASNSEAAIAPFFEPRLHLAHILGRAITPFHLRQFGHLELLPSRSGAECP